MDSPSLPAQIAFVGFPLWTWPGATNKLSMVEADTLLSWPSLSNLDVSNNYVRL